MSEFTGFNLKGEVPPEPKADKITLRNAVATPFWMAIWATEPDRLIDVRMSYEDLKIICDMIEKRMKHSGYTAWIRWRQRRHDD